MIRVLIFLIFVSLAALGAAWLADRPGDVVITWFGYRIETSVMVLIAVTAVLMVLSVLLWTLLRTILNSPYLLSRFIRNRRGARGYQAISKGLIAVGAGDVRLARKFAAEARRIAAGEPLALLLAAQTAQLSGDRSAADAAFRAMARRPDTKLLGLHGLFVEARRRGDARTARACAEEAASNGPTPGWAGQAVLELRCAAGDWVGALEALERNYRSGLINKAIYWRHRAVLLNAQASAADESDRNRARPLALDAVKLAPTLVPAAALAGRLLAESGELRKASRIIERAWRDSPHPDLADAFAHLRIGDSARERLARVQSLAQKAPNHVESALAVARAAIDAQEFSTARTVLAPHLRTPTQRVAVLMAELEEAEHGDEGRAREWMARAVNAQRDPAWTADGIVSDRWLPVSPVSGRLDAFEWRVPVAELAAPQSRAITTDESSALIASRASAVAADAGELMVEDIKPDDAAAANPLVQRPDAAARPVTGEMPQAGAQPAAMEAADAAGRASRPQPAGNTGRGRARRMVEPISPLVRAPDDPGPELPAEPAADRRHLQDFLK
ncbi:MAG: heme biosynthesis protein HemY [Rhizobiales bacterium]|nr:heme biosynthesis protein HemY [Hyphomicrobiales bacterium]